MFKRASSLLGIALLPVVLAGCGLFGGAGNTISVHIQPTTLNFEYTYSVDEATGETSRSAEVSDSTLVFRNPAGGATATVVGYAVRYTDGAGDSIEDGEFDFENDALFSVVIPAGYVCPGETEQCVTGRIPQIMSSEPVSVGLVNINLALYMVPAFPTVFAEIDFTIEQGGATQVYTSRVSLVPTASGD